MTPSEMFRSLYTAATGMVAQETQLDTIANNLANANTHGYKRQRAEFEDLMYQTLKTPGRTPDGGICLLYTSPSPRDRQKSRMPSSA